MESRPFLLFRLVVRSSTFPPAGRSLAGGVLQRELVKGSLFKHPTVTFAQPPRAFHRPLLLRLGSLAAAVAVSQAAAQRAPLEGYLRAAAALSPPLAPLLLLASPPCGGGPPAPHEGLTAPRLCGEPLRGAVRGLGAQRVITSHSQLPSDPYFAHPTRHGAVSINADGTVVALRTRI